MRPYSAFMRHQNRVNRSMDRVGYTATGTTYTDADIAAWIMTAGVGVDAYGTSDADTGAWVLTASATELHTISDSAVASWVMSPVLPTGGSAIVSKFDSGSVSGVSTTTVITVPAAGVSSGNTLLVFNSKNATACVDSKGNTYVKDAASTGAGTSQGVALWRALITTPLVSGDTITLTHGSLSGRVGIAVEISGFLSSPIETAVTNVIDANGVSVSSASLTGAAATANANTRVFSAWTLDSNATSPLAGSGFNIEAQQSSSGTVRTLVVEDQILQTQGTPTAGISWTGTSTAYTGLLVAYDTTSAGSIETMQNVDAGTAAYVMTASGTDVKATAYVDAATAAYVLTASATENAQFVDSATAASVMVASATEIHTISDADTAFSVMTTSGTDIAQFVDSATGAYVLTGSATEIRTIPDADTGAYVMTASAAEEHDIFDTGTAAYVLTASAVEGRISTDAATAAYVLTTSGTEIAQFVDSNTAAWVMAGSGTSPEQSVESATAAWVMTAVPGSYVRVTDAFNRTTSPGWGNVDTPPNTPWKSTASTNYYTDGSKAYFLDPNDGVPYVQAIDYPHNDVYIKADLGFDALPSVGSSQHAIQYRSTANSNGYLAQLFLSPTGTLSLRQFMIDGSVLFDSFNIVVNTYSPGDLYTVEVMAVGSTLSARAYLAGTAAPNWQSIITDSTHLNGTQLGFRFLHPSAAAASSTRIVDNFSMSVVAFEVEDTVESGTASYVLTASGSEATPNVDSATGSYVLVGSASEAPVYVDSATAPYVLVGSATEVHEIPDSNTAVYVLTGSATQEGRVWSDSATAAYVSTASATELHTTFDSATAAYTLVGSATTELHTISDAGTGAYVLTGSATEQYGHLDSATAAYVLTASAPVEALSGIEAATGAFVLTAISVAEDYGKLDSATAAYVLTASAISEGRYWSDANTAQMLLYTTDIGTEFYYADSGTASSVMTASFVNEEIIRGDFDTAFMRLGVDLSIDSADFHAVDSDTAFFTFTARTVLEKMQFVDYFLVAVQSGKWDASQTDRWNASQTGHYVVAQSTRYSVLYRGRGFLNG